MKHLKYLLLLLATFATLSIAGNSEVSLQKHLHNYKQISGQFTQVINSTQSDQSQSSSGEFWIKKPGQFRWYYISPYIQKIISNGEKIWIYDEDLYQVTVKSSTNAIESSPLSIILGGSDMERHFIVSEIGEKDSLEWLSLSPKSESSGFDFIDIGFKSGKLNRMVMMDNFGQITELLFTNVTLNEPIDDELFEFQVPEGVDVFEEATE
jgi:outer membrane lipoprotein carrier protein